MRARIVQRPDTFDRVDRVKEVAGEPVLRGDDELWILGGPMGIEIDGREFIQVPKGFTTDGASVPKVAQAMTGWGKWEEPQRWAGIGHDYLYTQRGVRRVRADRVFRELLRSEGAHFWERSAMYWAVRVGGWKAYRTDQARGPMVYV